MKHLENIEKINDIIKKINDPKSDVDKTLSLLKESLNIIDLFENDMNELKKETSNIIDNN